MGEDEPHSSEAAEGAAEDKTRRPAGRPSGSREVPLFLRDSSDGSKGNAQDEKDEVGE
jgi:hypothetical protein